MDENNLLNQLLMLGIGTTSLLVEKLRDVANDWVKEGRINPDQAKEFIEEINERFKNEQINLEQLIQRQVKNIMQDLGIPRQNEIDELRGRIDRLERQVRDLENKHWR
ncbi:MAG: phasin family protein [Pseudanabaenaceae cyanobacterium]